MLAVLKDEEILPKDKQAMLEELLSSLSNDEYNSLYKISQGITDYVDEEDDGAGKEGDDEGIAVVFDDEEEDEGDELVDHLEEEEEEEDAMDVDQVPISSHSTRSSLESSLICISLFNTLLLKCLILFNLILRSKF